MLHSISDLTTFCRKTTGDVPAKLVGASTTVVGGKMYLFGGRLVAERRMVSDLYAFDLETLNWEKIHYTQDDPSDTPRPRYFHSADSWNNHLVIFGGMSNKLDSISPDDLCVLNDVRMFDLASNRWLPLASTNPSPLTMNAEPSPNSCVPRARYAHLSSVTADRLFVIGGQDFHNVWLDDVCVYDLRERTWIRKSEYPRHCGTYRSVAVSSEMCVRLPQEEMDGKPRGLPLGAPGARFRVDQTQAPKEEVTQPDSFLHLPYSAQPTEEVPSNIYLYSNYNFTDVKRELEVFSPLPASTQFSIAEHSSLMQGTAFPPGLRFPTGAIIGTHFIVAGTYLAHTYQSFSIWALDLISMTWSRIDPGNAVSTGSWFRGCIHPETNKFFVFGNRAGNLVDDYNRRLLSWEDVAVVDLEAFGIYQPPPLLVDIPMQELGLAALEEGVNADFEIVCEDGRKIACSRKILEVRWPWFKEQRKKFLQAAMEQLATMGTSTMDLPLPELPGAPVDGEPRPDPRLTPRALHLSEPYPIAMALLQYFYSTALLTPLQHAPAVLSQLLVLSTTYQIPHLEGLVKHAMHRALSNTTAVGVYEVATLCGSRSLQIRALKTVMSYNQKRPSRSKQDKDSGSDRPPDASRTNGSGPSDGGPSSSRPRGTSDARRVVGGGGGTMGMAPRGYTNRHNLPVPELSTILDDMDAYDGVLGVRGPGAGPPGSPSSRTDRALLSPTSAAGSRDRRNRGAQLDQRGSVCTIAHQELCAVGDLLDGHEARPGVLGEGHQRVASPTQHESALEMGFGRRAGVGEFSPSQGSSVYSESDCFDSSSDDRHELRAQTMPWGAHHNKATHVPPIITRRASDSDTPSLSSSATSLHSHWRNSPLTPVTSPLEYAPASNSAPHLDAIQERQHEDPEATYWMKDDMDALTIKAINSNEWPAYASSPEIKLQTVASPAHPGSGLQHTKLPPPPSVTSRSSGGSTDSGPKSPFARFLGVGRDKTDRSFSSGSSTSDFLVVDAKQAKAEEKKRKKAESKARTEKLAAELRKRQDERAELQSQESAERKKKVDPASMYGSSFSLIGA